MMKNVEPFTESQWYAMCSAGIGAPVPLHEGELDKPWVYYRPWGVMSVPGGYHTLAMATLFAFHHGYADSIAAGEALGIPGYRINETLADRFLTELEGTAFKSGMGKTITAGRKSSLNTAERQAMRTRSIYYLEGDDDE